LIPYAPCCFVYSAYAFPMSFSHHDGPKAPPEQSNWPLRKRLLRSARTGLQTASGKLPELRLRRC
jgi:hypothetical protein